MITVSTVRMTTWACPTQLVGTLTDGRTIYVRYRSGMLGVGIGTSEDDAAENEMLDAVLRDHRDYAAGHNMDGVITYEEIVRRTSDAITWPTHCEDASTEPSSRGV